MKSIFLTLCFLFCTSLTTAADTQPNVILMMADDLGYADLSCYGSKTIKTPVLDQLAAEGVRLTSFYSGCTICTPSRIALLTGAYPVRAGWKGGVVGYGVNPNNGLSPDAITMADVFRIAGYQTALIGKWHLGDSSAHTPNKQGFDTTYFINKSNNQTKQLWRGDKLEADPFDNRRLTEQFTREAISFIKTNQRRPFFLYLPFSAPHFPAQAHPDWQGKSQNHAYGDVVEELDSRIGDILSTLSELQLDKNTIVIFISDNGVEPGQKNWARANPYRGLKWSTLEGGNRVPGIIRWPEKITAGQVSDELIGAIDLLPTLAYACKLKTPQGNQNYLRMDGVNILDSLVGDGDSNRDHARKHLLFWHGWGTPQAIRSGKWKLYFDVVKELPDSKHGPVLFDLSKDPSEQTNLSQQHPDIVAMLQTEASRQLSEIKKNSIRLAGPPEPNAKTPKLPRWLK